MPAAGTQPAPAPAQRRQAFTGQQAGELRRDMIARRFAESYVANQFDHRRAYLEVVATANSMPSKRPRRTDVRMDRMALRWLALAAPYIARISRKAADDAGLSFQHLYATIKAAMDTSPATFLVKDEFGRVSFDLYKPGVTDLQRLMVRKLGIQEGRIVALEVPDVMKGIAAILKVRELELQDAKSSGGVNKADEIAKRFNRAKLVRIDNVSKPVVTLASNNR